MVKVLVKINRVIHYGILLFIVGGWLVPIGAVLLTHMVFIPLVMLQWKLNNGQCLLTNLENFFQGEKKTIGEQQGQFIKGIANHLLGYTPADDKLRKGLYAAITFAWLFSLLHYFLR